MDIKIKINTIIIKDEDSGKEYSVKSVRTAEDISAYVEESERSEAVHELERAVFDVINQE